MAATNLIYISKTVADPGRLLLRLKNNNIKAELKLKNTHKDRGFPAVCLVKVNLENKSKEEVEEIKKAIYSNNF